MYHVTCIIMSEHLFLIQIPMFKDPEKKNDTALHALSAALHSRCFPVAPPLQFVEGKRSLIPIMY